MFLKGLKIREKCFQCYVDACSSKRQAFISTQSSADFTYDQVVQLYVPYRLLTFILACFMCLAISVGMIIAIAAGIAYGYNFSMAEYIDNSKSDITVYVRRGTFGDKPPLHPIGRRSGGDPDMFSSNYSVDYEGPSVGDETKPLSEAWQKAQDTRSYAEKLTKYAKIRTNLRRFRDDDEELPATNIFQPNDENYFTQETPDLNSQNLDTPERTSLKPGGDHYDPSDPPLFMYTSTDSQAVHDHFNPEINEARHTFRKHKHKKLKRPDIKINVEDDTSLYVQPYNKTTTYLKREYDDAEYINMFKPV